MAISLILVDHAVSASTVYLVRSLGSVWGVAITASIIQNTLNWRLSDALSGVPNKEEVNSWNANVQFLCANLILR